MKNKILYACSGSADLIGTYHHWLKDESDPSEVSLTFSGQILDYCQQSNSDIYMISTNPKESIQEFENVTIEHRKKPNFSYLKASISYHFGEIYYGIGLLRSALKFRATIVLADSGVTHYFVLFLFRCFGIKVIPILHNTLWPSGFPPRQTVKKFVLWLDKWFFKYGANAILGVSNECGIQIKSITGDEVDDKIFQFRAQFNKNFFERIPPAPSFKTKPFTIIFAGRIEEFKGVFDILEIAERLNNKYPNKFQWIIGGTGPALVHLKEIAQSKKLLDFVDIKGWITPEELIGVHKDTHMAIVPTTSGFKEGLAMTAAEAILAHRPVITSPVVPALNEMKTACYEAKTNDIDSYVEGIEEMAFNEELYEKMKSACAVEGEQFLDRSKGLTAMLDHAINYCFKK